LNFRRPFAYLTVTAKAEVQARQDFAIPNDRAAGGPMEGFWKDLRFAARTLYKSPGFSLVVIILLALGIGANTAIFGVVNAILLRPPDVPAADQLVDVIEHNTTGGSSIDAFSPLSYPNYIYYRDHNTVFTGLTATGGDDLSVVWSRESQGEAIHGQLVAANYFDVLGVNPELGRVFLPDEDRNPGAPLVALISHAFWERSLGADPNIVSKQVTLNGVSFTIIGVIPASYHDIAIGITPDVWAPMNAHKIIHPSLDIENRFTSWLLVTGRLKAGKSLQNAQAEMLVLSKQIAAQYPDSDKYKEARAYRTTLVPGPYRGAIGLIGVALLVVVSLVLVIASANAANMLLARASARWREMAIRSALGASRWRLVRQTLAESVLLASIGGVAGLALAGAAVPLLMKLKPATLPLELDAPLDWRVTLFAFGVAIVTGVVFGLAPALQSSKLDLATQMKESVAGGRGKSRLRNALVVAQVTVCLVLLIGAGLCLRSLANAQSIDPGFGMKKGVIASLDAQTFGYDAARGRVLYRNLLQRVAAIPGVQGASLATPMPLSFSEDVEGFAIDRALVDDAQKIGPRQMRLNTADVAPGYFHTMEIPIFAGRDFTDADTTGAIPPARQTW
jgi:predicted permease